MTPEAEAMYDALPREVRLAALAALLEARKKTADHWPRMPMIFKHAKVYGADVDLVAGFFGFRIARLNGVPCWVDTVRGGPGSDVDLVDLFGQIIPQDDGFAFFELSFGEQFYPRVSPIRD